VKPWRPPDPFGDLKLDPRIPLPEEVVRVAIQAFPDAIRFMVFFNYSFLVVYEKSVDLEGIESLVPSSFGGLCVKVTHDSISFSSSAEEKKDETPAEEKKEEAPAPAKKGDRRSFFARFGKKETPAEKKEEESKPAEETGELPVSLSGQIEQSNNSTKVRSIVGE
jgi:hypothetical protein